MSILTFPSLFCFLLSATAAEVRFIGDTAQVYTTTSPFTRAPANFSTSSPSDYWYLAFWIKVTAATPDNSAFFSFDSASHGDSLSLVADEVVSTAFGTCDGVTAKIAEWIHVAYFCNELNLRLRVEKRDGTSCSLKGPAVEFQPAGMSISIPSTKITEQTVAVSLMDVRWEPSSTSTDLRLSVISCSTSGLPACPCHSTCNTCASSDQGACLTCKANASLYNPQSVYGQCRCNTGYYYDSIALACVGCHTSCSTCNNAKPCTSNCAPSCETCSGSGASQCLTCNPHASLPSGSSVGTCTCDIGFKPSLITGHCCASECTDTCFGDSSEDCFGEVVAPLYTYMPLIDQTLPYLQVTDNLICYRMPVLNECGLSFLQDLVGELDSNPRNLVLTNYQCNKYLEMQRPYIEVAYFSLFSGIQLPTTDQAKLQKAESLFKTWILQFGYYDISSNADWVAFLTSLKEITDWTQVAAYSAPPRYWDGTASKSFPSRLSNSIMGLHNDFELFNYWNSVPTEFFDAKCSTETASRCSAAGPSSISPCCLAHST